MMHPEEIKVMHSYYVVPEIVDGAVAKKQAWARLTDNRSGGEESIVHAHRWGDACTNHCSRYHICVSTGMPGSHSIAETCPMLIDGEEDADG